MPAPPERGRCSPPNTPIDARITANETQNGPFQPPEPHNAWLFEVPIWRSRRSIRTAAARTHPPRQCQALARPGSGRARVRGTEASHGTDRPNHRSRPSPHEDRHGQSCLQPPALRPTSGQCHRLTTHAGSVCPHLLKEGDAAPQTPRSMPESLQTRRKTVDSSRQNLTMHGYSRLPARIPITLARDLLHLLLHVCRPEPREGLTGIEPWSPFRVF